MPFQPIPYSPNRRDTTTMLDLILRRGDIAGQGAARSGMIWGRMANQLGQIGSQAYLGHQENKQQEEMALGDAEVKQAEQAQAAEKRQRFAQALEAPEVWGDDPMEGVRIFSQFLEPDEALQTVKTIQGFKQLAEKPDPAKARAELPGMARVILALPPEKRQGAYSAARGVLIASQLGSEEDFTPQWSEEMVPILEAMAQGLDPQKQPEPELPWDVQLEKATQMSAARARGTASAKSGGGVNPEMMNDMLAQAATGWQDFNGTHMTSDDFSIRSGLTRSQAKTAAGKAGVVLPSKKLTEVTLAAKAELADIEQVISDLEDPDRGPVIKAWIGKYKGNLASFLSEGWMEPLKTLGFAPEVPPEVYAFRANLNSIAAEKRHKIYGAAVTGTETPFARGFIPAMNQSYQAALANVKEMKDTIERGLHARWGTAKQVEAEASGQDEPGSSPDNPIVLE